MLSYVVLPPVMGHLDWPIRAGLTMVVTALLPWVAYELFNEPVGDAPGTGFAILLSAVMLLLALVPLSYGFVRMWRRRTRQAKG